MQAVGLGVFGGAAEGAGGEFCFAEEEAVVVGGGVSTLFLFTSFFFFFLGVGLGRTGCRTAPCARP